MIMNDDEKHIKKCRDIVIKLVQQFDTLCNNEPINFFELEQIVVLFAGGTIASALSKAVNDEVLSDKEKAMATIDRFSESLKRICSDMFNDLLIKTNDKDEEWQH